MIRRNDQVGNNPCRPCSTSRWQLHVEACALTRRSKQIFNADDATLERPSAPQLRERARAPSGDKVLTISDARAPQIDAEVWRTAHFAAPLGTF
jgi:hypothetical protein